MQTWDVDFPQYQADVVAAAFILNCKNALPDLCGEPSIIDSKLVTGALTATPFSRLTIRNPIRSAPKQESENPPVFDAVPLPKHGRGHQPNISSHSADSFRMQADFPSPRLRIVQRIAQLDEAPSSGHPVAPR
jgi:hypothetical protein